MKAYGFPGDAIVKNPPVNIRDKRDTSLIPELGRSPRERNGIPLQCSCLENSMDRGVHGVAMSLIVEDRKAWCAEDHGVTKSRTCLTATEQHTWR